MFFFSIVIPVYNRYQLAKETINSVLSQTFRDYEIIVVDDGSNDGTSELLQENFSGLSNLRILCQPNSERGVARNNGFKNSCGTYVVFLDSDDLLFHNHLETLHENIAQQNFPSFIATKFNFICKGKNVASPIRKIAGGYYDYKLFLNGNPIACNICVKRVNSQFHLFEENRDYAVLEDWLFMLQNLKEQKLFLVDEVTLSMLDHDERSMRSDHERLIRKAVLALDWIIEKISLAEKEKKQLAAHVNYFCAIHSYLAGKRGDCTKYILAAAEQDGFSIKYCILLLKSLFGYRLISKLKP